MASSLHTSRRRFLTSSAATAASVALSGVSTPARGAWTDGTRIHPTIDNLRVVYAHDSDMVNATPTSWSFTKQNDAINTSRVETNLDTMAVALAQTSTAAEAWNTIFRSSKSWPQTRVAIKVNTINTSNMPRIAIVGKICTELMNLGVPAGNIVVFDSCTNRGNIHIENNYPSYVGTGLPSGVLISRAGDHLGGDANSYPVPGYGNKRCVEDIAQGAVDILVNCAVNKGHSNWNGECTLCMKNHYGTFAPASHNDVGYITALSKSDAIIGGNPPRQQLCILDSLFAGYSGPHGNPNFYLDRILMGVFAPAIDYATAKYIREDIMERSANSKVDRFLTDFGYTTSDLPASALVDALEYTPTIGVPHNRRSSSESRGFTFQTTSGLSEKTGFSLSAMGKVERLLIHAPNGATVADILAPGERFLWDGRDTAGKRVPTGCYVVDVQGRSRRMSRTVSVVR